MPNSEKKQATPYMTVRLVWKECWRLTLLDKANERKSDACPGEKERPAEKANQVEVHRVHMAHVLVDARATGRHSRLALASRPA